MIALNARTRRLYQHQRKFFRFYFWNPDFGIVWHKGNYNRLVAAHLRMEINRIETSSHNIFDQLQEAVVLKNPPKKISTKS